MAGASHINGLSKGPIGGIATMTRQITRRQVLAAGAATVATAAMGPFTSARAAGAHRPSCVLVGAARQIRRALSLVQAVRGQPQAARRRPDQARILPQQPIGQGSGRRAAGQGGLRRHDDQRPFDLGHDRAGNRRARPGLPVRQLRARIQGDRRRRVRRVRQAAARSSGRHSARLGLPGRRAQRVHEDAGQVGRRAQRREAARAARRRRSSTRSR